MLGSQLVSTCIFATVLGWRPSLLCWRPSLLGWRPSLQGWRPSLLGWPVELCSLHRYGSIPMPQQLRVMPSCFEWPRTVPSSLFCCLYRLFTIGLAGVYLVYWASYFNSWNAWRTFRKHQKPNESNILCFQIKFLTHVRGHSMVQYLYRVLCCHCQCFKILKTLGQDLVTCSCGPGTEQAIVICYNPNSAWLILILIDPAAGLSYDELSLLCESKAWTWIYPHLLDIASYS